MPGPTSSGVTGAAAFKAAGGAAAGGALLSAIVVGLGGLIFGCGLP